MKIDVKFEIVNKRIKNTWFTEKYIFDIKETITRRVVSRSVDKTFYYSYNVSDILNIVMYSNDGDSWYFSADEAGIIEDINNNMKTNLYLKTGLSIEDVDNMSVKEVLNFKRKK